MYYEKIKKEIEILIDENKNYEALELISEELKMPYIPQEFENFLKLNKKKITKELELNNKVESKLDVEDIKNILLNPVDVWMQIFVIKSLENMNARNLIPEISNFLSNENVFPENKTFMLLMLSEQNIDFQFNVEKFGKNFKINPIDIKINNFEKIIESIKTITENTIGNDNPSLANVCLEYLTTYVLAIFPKFINDSQINSLIAAGITKANIAYGNNAKLENLQQVIKFDLDLAINFFNELDFLKFGETYD
ncbi:hypothetical protein ESOMN_v1c04340 [Williamsoniiplasma somnilux]|uniref:Uncharacterized protein n=1 Tax=Williamsoniiplasma somnilux TaxID=215578 RepID=A0A2K8NZ29_9MOLU|nr:DUF3196 family protein [Williamsoniiplasma somnilux]ATZ18816.1 hypothetical protein ESOMN_v1c04340 [Williamsoniiplasma somnilux]